MNKIKNIVRNIALLLMLFVSISAVAQGVKSQGTRITDNLTSKDLNSTAILDLDSSSKGFFMPRMNEAQRNALEEKLIKEGGNNTGLAIYNIDNDCIEYWHSSTQKWRSLCGSLPPAEIKVNGSCSDIVFNGFTLDENNQPYLQQGKLLTESQTITIPINVEKIGTYTASITSGNGYFFSGEGQFQATGPYRIILKGAGMPVKGYSDGTKDKLTININGKDSEICTKDDFQIKVIPAALKLTIKNGAYKAAGKYYVNESAAGKPANKLVIDINVTSGGTAQISAFAPNFGIKFSGQKDVTIGDHSFELLPVVGEATATSNDEASYTLQFGTNAANEQEAVGGRAATIVIEETSISFDPAKVNFGEEPFYQGTAVNDKNKVTIPVKIIGSGRTDLKLRNAEGVEFEAKGVVLNRTPADLEATFPVTFTKVEGNTAKMPEADTSEFTLTGNGKRFKIVGGDKVTFKLDKKPVTYTIDCSKTKSNRSAIPYNVKVGKSYYIIMTVNVVVPGEYEINTTGSADGVEFSSSEDGVKKVFKKPGEQEVILYPKDPDVIPKNRKTYQMGIVTNDGSNAAGCINYDVKVGFADLNILHFIGTDETKLAEFFKGKDGDNPLKDRFGPEGAKAETGLVTYTPYRVTSIGGDNRNKTADNGDPVKRSAMAKRIAKGDFNLIIVEVQDFGRSLDQEMFDAITGYLKKGKAFVLVSYAPRASNNGKLFTDVVSTISDVIYKDEYFGPVDNRQFIKPFYTAFNGGNEMKMKGGAVLTYSKPVAVNTPFAQTPYALKDGKYVCTLVVNDFSGFDLRGSKFKALVSKDGTEDGVVSYARHVDFPKQVWILGMFTNGRGTGFGGYSNFTDSGEPSTGHLTDHDTGRFSANLLIDIVKIIVSE